MRYYIGIIHKDPDSDFGVSFPDFLGCISAGRTLDEAISMGAEALGGHIELMAEDGEAIPEPSSMDQVMADPAYRDGIPVLIPAPRLSTKAVRVNITMPEDTLREIDNYAERRGLTRSGFLAQAARQVMAA